MNRLFVNCAFVAAIAVLGSQISSGQEASGALQQSNGQTAADPDGISQYDHMLNRAPVAPDFLPLAADHEQYLGQLLDHWEKTSSQIKQLTCDYERWDYDPAYCHWRDPNPNDNRLAAFKFVRGKIRYGSPDKADIQSTEIWDFAGTINDAGQEANFVLNRSEEAVERWMCDGKAIYEFEYTQKKLIEARIPPEMQGEALSQSPLPFLFGAKRADMQDRFWMRISTPPGVDSEYWIEAWPKRADDARNYDHVDIVISAQDFLPKSVHIYRPGYDAKESPKSHHFEFANKQVNGDLSKIRDFFGVFIRPKTPGGWERIELDRPVSEGDRSAASADDQNQGLPAGQQTIDRN